MSSEQENRLTIIVLNYSFDGLYHCFTIATGALSSRMQVNIFFTSAAVLALTKVGLKIAPLSVTAIPFPGRFVLRRVKGRKDIASLEELIRKFKELGGKIIACDTTLEFFGIKKKYIREDLIDDYWAVGRYILSARSSKLNLII